MNQDYLGKACLVSTTFLASYCGTIWSWLIFGLIVRYIGRFPKSDCWLTAMKWTRPCWCLFRRTFSVGMHSTSIWTAGSYPWCTMKNSKLHFYFYPNFWTFPRRDPSIFRSPNQKCSECLLSTTLTEFLHLYFCLSCKIMRGVLLCPLLKSCSVLRTCSVNILDRCQDGNSSSIEVLSLMIFFCWKVWRIRD